MPEGSETLVEIGKRVNAEKNSLKDRGRRRHVSWGMDFDTRSVILNQEIGANWEENNQKLLRGNQDKIREQLKREFGELQIDEKIENFIAIGSKPFSIISYHNRFFHQVRQAYVVGAYYPALVGACSLGERILNHLIIDLRDFFSSTPEYQKVYRKQSFDNWDVPINALTSWGVLLPDVIVEFGDLKSLRHRSIHFNSETYSTVKEDALTAILHVSKIIDRQFGSYGLQPWFLRGTNGHQFIARDWEVNPFIQTYFLPNFPFVGPFFSMEYSEDGWQFIDVADYGQDDFTDEEFAQAFNERKPEDLARKSDSHENEIK